MNAADILVLYDQLEKLGVKLWLDGGWAVDALLDKQTRPHKDVERDDTSAWNFVLGDP